MNLVRAAPDVLLQAVFMYRAERKLQLHHVMSEWKRMTQTLDKADPESDVSLS